MLAFLAGFAMVCFAAPTVPACGWTACGNVPWAAIGVGLALAIFIVAWTHRTAAVVLAALAAGVWWLALREGQPPTWITAGVTLLASGGAIMALVPWRDTASDPGRKSATGLPASSAQPPAETGFTWVARRTTAASIVLVVLGSSLLWWLVQRRLPWWFGSEGVWYVWAVAAVGLGLGLGWRATSLNRSRRRFFATPQPVRSVQVIEHTTGAYVALPGWAIAHFPIRAGFPARLEMYGGPRCVWRGANMRSGRERPALLYGDPLAGRWCAVVVDSQLLAPFGSIEILSDLQARDLKSHRPSQAAYGIYADYEDDDDNRDPDPDPDPDPDGDRDGDRDRDRDGDGDGRYGQDGEGGRDPGYDPGDLTAADRSAGPGGLRTHRLAWKRAYALVPLAVAAVVVGATMVGFVGFIGEFHPSVSVLVALALALLGAEIVWRVLVRPRFAWNDSGIALVTGSGVRYLPWRDVSSIERDDGVKILAEPENHVISTYAVSRWLAPGERSPQQLIAALLDSKRRAEGTPTAYLPSPPPLDYPARSPMLWMLASGSAIVLAYVLLALTNSGR